MASRPYFDGRGWWLCKFRPDPVGEWKVARLCKHPGPWSKARPPRKPPKLAEDRQREFADIEYRARHGLAAAAAGPKGLEGYVARYLDLYRVAQRPGSVRQMERHARSFLAFARARGIATVQAVGKADVRDYLEMRFGKGASHGTLRTEWGYLAGIWSRAVEDGLVAASPWTGVRPPGKPAEPGWTLWTPDEIERIAAAMGKPWQRDFVRVLGHTGFRLSTGLALAWDWIDWRRGTVTIPAGPEIKTRYLHVLGDEARAVLERRQVEAGKSDLVFPNPYGGKVVPADTVRDALHRAVAKAGVRPGTPHDLRHSYARNLVLAGVPITVVSRQLGHASLAMTMRYTTADQENVREALERARLSPP
jgi:integrase